MLNTSSVLAPFAAVVLVTMMWNWLRFGHPFDFGASYNLTGFDMTTREVNTARTAFSAFLYLCAPLVFCDEFSFMTNYTAGTPLFGSFEWRTSTIVERYYGGVVTFYPLVLVVGGLLFRSKRNELKRRSMLGTSVLALILALALMLIDSSVAVTHRYQSDFMWLIVMAAVACGITVQDWAPSGDGTIYIGLYSALTLFTVFLVLVNLFATSRYGDLFTNNPDVYRSVESWFLTLFWSKFRVLP